MTCTICKNSNNDTRCIMLYAWLLAGLKDVISDHLVEVKD